MNKLLVCGLALGLVATAAQAQMRGDDCDRNQSSCEKGETKDPLKGIYPYKPLTTKELQEKLIRITENKDFLWDIEEMERRGLKRANTAKQPWGSSFWPLYQGMVANTYQDKDTTFFITTLLENLSWKENVKDFKNRKVNVLPKIYELEEKALAKLAPSEKYDILMGDTSFDLTNRVWKYVEAWGREKQWGKDHLRFINFQEVEDKGFRADDYRAPKPNDLMALWEGICHGWALGAGLAPRPEKTVEFTLPNGKKLPFYASDIKALVSLMFANSDIQDYALVEGNKCNKKDPDRDRYGRYIDVKKDPFLDPANDPNPVPRCADVHPAVFHVSMINILGLEGRSFVVDHNPKAPVANQPVSGYEYDFFNPDTGKEGPLKTTMISIRNYPKDPYKVSRNPEAAYIVGVNMNVQFIDWELPKKQETSSPDKDNIKDFKFKYDLEISADGRVVGGQWRAKSVSGGTNQPDYFWVAPREWKKFVAPVDGLPEWKDGLPPQEYRERALTDMNLHSYIRFEDRECPVFPKDGKGPMLKVKCGHKFARPRPVNQIIHRLLELSSRSSL